VQKKNVSVKDLSEITSDEKLAKAFQLLAYALMYHKMHPQNKFDIVSGNISFRKLSAWFIPVNVNKQELLNEDILTEFEEALIGLIGKLFDSEMHFKHNHDAQYCNFCDI